ncbi:MAG: hypothetical protein AAB954_02215, partial [Patescibacteria group bacterium]
MRRLFILSFIVLSLFLAAVFDPVSSLAVKVSPSPSPSPVATVEPTATPVVVPDLTQKTPQTLGPLEKLLNEQVMGKTIFNPVK